MALFFGMPVEGLHQRSTARAVTVPRQIAMYLVKQMTDASLPEIERHFGGKHHYADLSTDSSSCVDLGVPAHFGEHFRNYFLATDPTRSGTSQHAIPAR